MFPIIGQQYVPGFTKEGEQAPPTIEYVREHGEICAVSEDGTRATVGVKHGMTVSFVGVSLTPEGKVDDFLRKTINKYVRVVPVERDPLPPQQFKQYDPPEPR